MRLLRGVSAAFVDLILPLAVPGTFTYALPEGMAVPLVGARLVVAFGRGRKLYTGIVRRIHHERPANREPREVLSVMDTAPIANVQQLELWDRIADHYLCTLGEVMIAALPGMLVLSSETRLMAGIARDRELSGLGRESVLLDAIAAREMITLDQAGELLGLKDPMPVVKKLLDDGSLMLAESVHDTYKERMKKYVQLEASLRSEEVLHALFDRLEKAPKQLHLLMKYVELSRCLSPDPREVERDLLVRSSGVTPAVLKQLVDKGVFEVVELPAGFQPGSRDGTAVDLSPAQSKALEELRNALDTHPVALLHGVTSSGKTELYVKLIAEQIEQGRQALYLLPEIALTTQVIGRLKTRFGDQVAVYHSRLNDRERVDLWHRMLRADQAPPIVVGARSAIFLPFQQLGLVIVDEEHDPSYKQQDPGPRYQARDMSIVLAHLHGARTLLGSATPSMESLFNAHGGKYGYAELTTRFGDAALPTIALVDLRDAYRRKKMKGHLSDQLAEAVVQAIARREQVILFQNRRGYTPLWQCETCAWIPTCEHCDAGLTYHKAEHGLRCHYCGRAYTPPTECRSCGGRRIRMLGFGTEKIEEELQLTFPEARIARMDQDTTRGKQAFEKILARFGEGAIDILVGTQMVTKGLDFATVSVVGVLNADQLMRHPDLRAHERAFQLMAQVAGRSGRGTSPGTVYIQAHDIHHPVIGLVATHDVEGFYQRELEHRRAHGYPPFSRLVRLLIKHRAEERVVRTAEELAARLRPIFGDRLLGPEPPLVARVRDLHLRTAVIKLRKDRYLEEKKLLRDAMDELFAMPEHSPVRLQIDVDPM